MKNYVVIRLLCVGGLLWPRRSLSDLLRNAQFIHTGVDELLMNHPSFFWSEIDDYGEIRLC